MAKTERGRAAIRPGISLLTLFGWRRPFDSLDNGRARPAFGFAHRNELTGLGVAADLGCGTFALSHLNLLGERLCKERRITGR